MKQPSVSQLAWGLLSSLLLQDGPHNPHLHLREEAAQATPRNGNDVYASYMLTIWTFQWELPYGKIPYGNPIGKWQISKDRIQNL